jgi:hypothetical protein
MEQAWAPKNTKALVEAFNNSIETKDKQQQDTLMRWIKAYIDWLNKQTVYNLTCEKNILEQYRHLAQLRPATADQEHLLSSYFANLVRRFREAVGGLEEKPLMAVVVDALRHLPPAVFGSDPIPLINLARQLLTNLNDENNVFTKNAYPTQGPRLDALYQVLLLIQEKDPSSWPSLKQGRLYQRFREGLRGIQRAPESIYPIRYRCKILLQSLIALELHPGLARAQDCFRRTRQFSTGLFHLYQGVRAAAEFKIDIRSLEAAFNALKSAADSRRESEEVWYEWHELLEAACMLSLQDASCYENKFIPEYQEVVAAQFSGGSGEKALCYGLVLQLRQLALLGPTDAVCQGSLAKLAELSSQQPWSSDGDLLEVLLDSLASVCLQGKDDKARDQAKTYL